MYITTFRRSSDFVTERFDEEVKAYPATIEKEVELPILSTILSLIFSPFFC